MEKQRPYVSRFVLELMPEASQDELVRAQANLENFMGVLYRICERLEREEQQARDNLAGGDTVKANTNAA